MYRPANKEFGQDNFEEDERNKNDEEEDEEPKYLKGTQIKSIFGAAPPMAPETALRARVTSVASPDFNEQREMTNYKNYTCTFAIKNGHEGRINCIAYVLNGTVLTGGADKMIRVWSPLEPKPLGQLEDDLPISHLVRMGKTSQQDVTLLYVACKVIRYLSIK